MSLCVLCEAPLMARDTAVFSCGHTFHLSCVFKRPFSTTCATCAPEPKLLPDFGKDRDVAVAAATYQRIEKRRLKDARPMHFMEHVTRMITPLVPKARTMRDHVMHNKKLSVIQAYGFGPDDAVRERIPWSDIQSRFTGKDVLEFGFTWDHMVDMGIVPTHLNSFTWTQQKHKLQMNAEKMLKMRITVTELANLSYTTHQLVELGFTWPILSQMGANVSTWPNFKFSLGDIKRYWSPTLSQWVAAGFYDKDRVQQAGWSMEDIMEHLPAMSQRATGRSLRLAF